MGVELQSEGLVKTWKESDWVFTSSVRVLWLRLGFKGLEWV